MNPPIEVEARANHPELKSGQGSGTLHVHDEGVDYTPLPSEDESREPPTALLRLPKEGLRLRLGGAADRLIMISHPDYPDWNLMSHDKTLLRHPAWQDHGDVIHVRTRLERKFKLLWIGLAATILILVLGCVGIWKGLDPASRWVAEKIPPEAESALGEAAFEQISSQSKVIEDPQLTAKLNELAEPLVQSIDSDRYTFQFAIVEDDSINAFALPGGYMAIHTGLILKADRAEEVLGVMAHELAHVTEQHSMRILVKHLGIRLIISSLIGDMGAVSEVLIQNAPMLLQLKFSRDHETEADTVGFNTLERANIDPRGMIDFFKKIKAEHEDEGIPMEGSLSILSTHPATDDRIQNLDRLIEEESHGGPYKYLDLNFRQFQDMLRAKLEAPE